MSQKETFLLPDGRKTSDLKVTELKKELEKKGLSKSGNKSELLIRLNESINDNLDTSQIEKENSVSSESQNEVGEDHNQISYTKQDKLDENQRNDHRVVNIKKSLDAGVDLDASDDMEKDNADISQSVDALDLYVPVDDSLNPLDESVQEERIQVTISRNDETEMKSDDESNNRVVETVINERTVICNSNDSEKEDTIDMECIVDDSDLKDGKRIESEKVEPVSTTDQEVTENEGDEIENIDLVTQIEMYEVDNIDLDGQMEIYEEHKVDTEQNTGEKAIESCDTDNGIVVAVKQQEEIHESAPVDETEEGEVVTVPITARLGKRKVKEESKSHSSPKKSKKKGLKETKGAGYIVEGPERIQPAQKSRNIISDVLRVDNLVRPFTLPQLQDMLGTQGVVKDLWLNKIKSVAYVRYESEAVAINARENIDGCRWPSINPKLLSCDFVFLKELDWMKEKGDSGANPPPCFNPSIANQNAIKDNSSKPHHQHDHKHQQHEQLAKPAIENNWRQVGPPDSGKVRSNHTNSRGTHADNTYKLDNISNNIAPKPSSEDIKRMRGKDRDMLDNKLQHRRTPNAEHRRRHDSPKEHQSRERVREKSKDKVLPAAKLLEDIFRKTTTQPAIYWLPVAKEKKDDPIKKAKEVTNKLGADL